MPYAVIETYGDGVNVLLHNKEENAINRFLVILEEVFLNPNMNDEEREEVFKDALKNRYYGIGFGDIEQIQTLEIRSIEFED